MRKKLMVMAMVMGLSSTSLPAKAQTLEMQGFTCGDASAQFVNTNGTLGLTIDLTGYGLAGVQILGVQGLAPKLLTFNGPPAGLPGNIISSSVNIYGTYSDNLGKTHIFDTQLAETIASTSYGANLATIVKGGTLQSLYIKVGQLSYGPPAVTGKATITNVTLNGKRISTYVLTNESCPFAGAAG